MTLPNFLIVGVPKAGTTTAADLLIQHPQVGMSIMKEPNFFSDGWPQWASSLKEYEELFSDCAGKKAVGEASPFYILDPASAEKIKQTLGRDIKIVICLRNPAKRTYSHWAHEHYKYHRDPLSFHQALEQEEQRAHAPETLKLKYYFPGAFRYVWNSSYADKVRFYMDVFGRENVKVLILEELIESPKEQFADLSRFLGIDDTFFPDLIQSNAASETLAPGMTSIVSRINQSRWFVWVYRKMPFVIKKLIFNLGNAVFEIFQRPLKKNVGEGEELDPDTYKRLMEAFMPDIHNLEKLLGRDLSLWYRDVNQ